MNRPTTPAAPSAIEHEGSREQYALTRAEAIQNALLLNPDWLAQARLRARSDVGAVVKGKGRTPTRGQLAYHVGQQLALDAYYMALGQLRGERMVEEMMTGDGGTAELAAGPAASPDADA